MIKKVVIGILLVLLALMLGVYLSLPSFVDKEAIKSEFVSSFKAATGFDIEVNGDVSFKPFPSPHVIVNSVYVRNLPGGISPFLLRLKLVDIWPTYTSLLRKHVAIGKVSVDGMDIQLERLKNNRINWQPPEPSAVAGSSAHANGLDGVTIRVANGYIHYIDEAANLTSEYKNIDATFKNGGTHSESTLKLSLHYKDKPFVISGKMGNMRQAFFEGETPAALTVVSGKSNFAYEGKAGYTGGKPSAHGKIKISTDDIGRWIALLCNAEKTTAGDAKPQEAAEQKLLPLEAKSSVTTENGKILLPDIALDGPVIKGSANAQFDGPYDIVLKAQLGMLDLESFLLNETFARKAEGTDPGRSDSAFKDSGVVIAPKPFFSLLNMSADLAFADIIYNAQHIRDAHIEFDTTGGEMTISQVTAKLPGEGKMIFAGLGKEGLQGLTLEGQLDASGEDFVEALKLLRASGATIPTADFKRYKLKANVIFSPKELRLSELSARIENMTFLGGFIAAFGKRIKLDAAMRIGGLNLDRFTQIWGIEEWRKSLSTDAPPGTKYDSFLAQWLRQLDYDTNMNVSLEQFMLNGMQRERADFKLITVNGKAALNDLKTIYNGTQLAGSVALDVTNPLPKMDIKLTADTFDTAVFFSPDGKPLPPTPQLGMDKGRWSHQAFDFHWLDMMTLSFRLKFGQYRQGLVTAETLDIQGGVDDRMLTIDALTGTVLGAQVAGKASIQGGKIPAIRLAANVTGLDSTRMVPFLPVLQGMTGKYNLSVRLDTSGIDMFSWISSLEGSVGFGGEQVNIHGFNMAAVVHAVSYVRTVADILNVVKRAFPGGDTMFNSIEGQWTVAGGVFKTANSRLTNELADGVLASQIDLINWQMQTLINLLLKTLDPAHPPSMTITFNGDIDHPEIALDTRSLEQYVTNKTSQQMLQQYGTH